MKAATHNLHVPLPDALYKRLRRESVRAKQPATALAREAIVRFVAEAERRAAHDAIASYAAGVAGSRDDLDPLLERAAVEHLASKPTPKRVRKAKK